MYNVIRLGIQNIRVVTQNLSCLFHRYAAAKFNHLGVTEYFESLLAGSEYTKTRKVFLTFISSLTKFHNDFIRNISLVWWRWLRSHDVEKLANRKARNNARDNGSFIMSNSCGWLVERSTARLVSNNSEPAPAPIHNFICSATAAT